MSGDYSRLTFDPAHDYAGVQLQQGRPLLDSDWNDWVAQLGRRIQAGAFDTFGPTAVVPLTTPDGFKLALSGTSFTIGRGRIYVDGLLAENHGLPPLTWDTALAEQFGASPVPYDQQPYLPNPPPLPTSAGPHVVYVDVWEREVTQFEAPGLVDKALGVDTTTRLQTVWQVKVLANTQGAQLACDTDPASIPGWSALTAPSAGRLTTATATFGEPNPCLIPPSGGYTGLENQLYRIEIQDGGGPGTATFKWSRDNGSVETRVTAMPDPTTLVVDSVGRDGVLRFNDGDWIELTDDWLEFAGEAGELHQIVVGGGVDDATRTITLTTPVTAGRFNPDPAANRHTRLRRWDQKGQVLRTDTSPPSVYVDLDAPGSTGAITVPADSALAVALESGIVVSFDLADPAGAFRPGDWWVFAARTADASVELLDHAPPRGIHHHYARLGLYTPGGQPTDCRTFWPPSFGAESCCCTVCVTPAAHAQGAPTIQQAIDTVIARGGGTVCLDVGQYILREPLVINGARTLGLRGQGQATLLIARGTGAINVGNAADVVLEAFEVQGTAADGQAVAAGISITDGRSIRLEQLGLLLRTAGTTSPAIALAGTCTGLAVRGCTISAPLGLLSAAGSDQKTPDLVLQDLLIADNQFQCTSGAIRLQLATGSQVLDIVRNQISQCQFGIQITGTGIPDAALTIAGNRIDVPGSGIGLGVPGLRVLDNDVSQADAKASAQSTFGIVLMPTRDTTMQAGEAHLLANRISGFSSAGIFVESTLAKLQIKQNQVQGCGQGIEVTATTTAEQLSIENNQISDITPTLTETTGTRIVGVAVTGSRVVSICGNTIERVAQNVTEANVTVLGVSVQGSEVLHVTGNALSEVGAGATFFGSVVGVLVQGSAGDVLIGDNRIRRDAATVAPDASMWFGIVVTGPTGANVAGAVVEEAALPDAIQRFLPAAAGVARLDARVAIRGNQLTARGGTFSVAVVNVALCDFSNNQSERTASADAAGNTPIPDVFLSAQAVVVAANRVVGPKAHSILLQTPEGRFSVLGNLTSGDILVQNAPLGAPWAPLNVHAT